MLELIAAVISHLRNSVGVETRKEGSVCMKEIRFSEHSKLKLEILANHAVSVDTVFIINVVRSPDTLEPGEEAQQIAQKRLDNNRVLRVVYREFAAFMVIIRFMSEDTVTALLAS